MINFKQKTTLSLHCMSKSIGFEDRFQNLYSSLHKNVS